MGKKGKKDKEKEIAKVVDARGSVKEKEEEKERKSRGKRNVARNEFSFFKTRLSKRFATRARRGKNETGA